MRRSFVGEDCGGEVGPIRVVLGKYPAQFQKYYIGNEWVRRFFENSYKNHHEMD